MAGVAALAVCCWRIGRPTYWRDESVSVALGSGSVGELREFFGDVDVVHGLYYAFLHVVTVFGTGEAVTRFPSALAAGLAAAGIAWLGQRFHSTAAGVCGGLIYGLLPITTRYGQEARQYALVSAGAVLVTLLLVRALEKPRVGRLVAYALAMGVLSWLHLYALYLLPAHVIVVFLWTGERRLWRWVATWAGALVLAVPLALVARGQEDAQVSWLERPGVGVFYDFGLLVAGGSRVLLGAVVILALVGVVWAVRERNVLVVAWLFVPILVAVLISQVHPAYHPRYVLHTVCALALVAGIGMAELAGRASRAGVPLIVVVLVGLVVLGLPEHRRLREADGRPDDLRSMADVLRAQARDGDAVLFVPDYRRAFATAYGDAFEPLRELPAKNLREELGRERRIWLVEVPPPGHRYRTAVPRRNLKVLKGDGRFRVVGVWKFGGVSLSRFEGR